MNIGVPRQHRPRVAIFVAGVAPMAIWPLSGAPLAHPFEAALWAALYAALFGFAPARFARLFAWVLLLALPLTLAWLGTIAVTGAGPSDILRTAALSASPGEVLQSAKMAFGKPAFLITALLCCVASVWAVQSSRAPLPSGTANGLFFFMALLTLFAAQSNLAALRWATAGPESKNAVPWMAHVETGGQMLGAAINLATIGRPIAEERMRNVLGAPRLFEAKAQLAVFVVGESLRADALMDNGRGPWSQRLRERLAAGLGARAPDACASSNATFFAVPRLLTAVDPADAVRAETAPTILALARAAGARTAWLSNQEDWVVVETGHDVMIKTAAGYMAASLDETLVRALDDFVLLNPAGPRAVLLHLHGQHFDYDDRYPAGFLGPLPAGLSGDAAEEQHYQRAAEYGAKVLLDAADILDRQTEPAFLIFTSDHGENLASDGTGKKYHAGPVSGRFDTTVPVLLLWNRAFAQTGRLKRVAALLQPRPPGDLLAHRDVARAWLLLTGMPGELAPLSPALTLSGDRIVPCATLPP